MEGLSLPGKSFYGTAGQLPGVGVTKAPVAIFSVNKIFDPAKVPVRFTESHSNWISNPHPILQVNFTRNIDNFTP